MRYPVAGVLLFLMVNGVIAEEKSPVGRKIDSFTLQDCRGKEWSLKDYNKGKLVVIAFLGTECSLAKLYGPKLGKLAKEYEKKGVAFLGVDSNTQDSLSAISAYARASEIEFPILRDLGNKVADQFGAQRTPTVYVLDPERTIQYAGRIDDQFGINVKKERPTTKDLVNALEQLLVRKKVTVALTEAPGCFIGRARQPKPSTVTYSNQIARILNARCVECHRKGEIAPFELTSYTQAAGFAESIVEVVEEGRMPPWHASPEHGKFVNERRLSEPEKKLIKDWVAAGAPEGNKKDLPHVPIFPENGWQLSRHPDAIIDMRSTPFIVPADGQVKYQYFVADTNFKEDKWVGAIEVRPGNRAVVHHILVFALGHDGMVGVNGVHGFLGAYVPGLRVLPFPDEMAKRIPAGTKLLFQIHYTSAGSKQKDISKIGFLFADPAKVKYEVRTISSANQKGLLIPPGVDNQKIEANRTMRVDAQLLAMMPHMHLRGKSFFYEAIYPDGKKETLLDVPHFDFNWQSSYRLQDPKFLPVGTKIHAVAVFDNSNKNLNNPNPAKTVKWGDQSWDEMMVGYFDIAVDKNKVGVLDEVHIPKEGVTIPDKLKAPFRQFDQNGDGKLDEKEISAMPPFLKQRVLDYIESLQGDGND